MAIIENFAILSEQEQRDFAEAMLKTINSEWIFSGETHFKLNRIETDDLTGSLWLDISQTDPIEVSCEATWLCADEDEAYRTPYDAEYENDLRKDAAAAFKTLSTEIDGYKVTLEIHDAEAIEIIEVDVDDISQEDDGIGSYEFWGYQGYDSRPYCEVTGSIVRSCDCALALLIEPIDEAPTKEVLAEPEAAESEVEEEI